MIVDKLETIINEQRKLSEKIGPSGTLSDRVFLVSSALVHEAIELQRETNWKWWKKDTPLEIKKMKVEFIDIFHFVIQLAIELGMDADEILAVYLEKNKINHERRDSNEY